MHRFLLGDSSVHISMDTQTCTNDRKKKSHKFIYSQRDGNTVLILKSSLCWPSHRMGYLFHPHSSLKSSSLSSVPFHHQHNSSFPVSQHRREWTAWRWSNSMPRIRLPQLLEVLEFWLYMTLEWIFAQNFCLEWIFCLLRETPIWGNFQLDGRENGRLLKERLRWDPALKPAVLLRVQKCVHIGVREQRS